MCGWKAGRRRPLEGSPGWNTPRPPGHFEFLLDMLVLLRDSVGLLV